MIQLFIYNKPTDKKHLTVRDTRGQILYLIEGSWGRKDDLLTLSTLQGELLLSAKQNKLSPLPNFDLTAQGEKVGTIRKHPGLFGIRDSFFTVHPQEWMVTGDFEELYFTIHQDNHLLGECEKLMTKGSDIFSLQLENEEDAPLGSLLTALLDHYSRKHTEDDEFEEFYQANYRLGFLNNIHFSVSYKNKKRLK